VDIPSSGSRCGFSYLKIILKLFPSTPPLSTTKDGLAAFLFDRLVLKTFSFLDIQLLCPVLKFADHFFVFEIGFLPAAASLHLFTFVSPVIGETTLTSLPLPHSRS